MQEYAILLEENENLQRQFQVIYLLILYTMNACFIDFLIMLINFKEV